MKGWVLIKPLAIVALLLQTGSIVAQTDSVNQVNRLSIGLDFLTHGEVCGGGLPKSVTEKSDEEGSIEVVSADHREYRISDLDGTGRNQLYGLLRNRGCPQLDAPYYYMSLTAYSVGISYLFLRLSDLRGWEGWKPMWGERTP